MATQKETSLELMFQQSQNEFLEWRCQSLDRKKFLKKWWVRWRRKVIFLKNGEKVEFENFKKTFIKNFLTMYM